EIIARIKYRGHVAKKLSALIFDGTVEVNAGSIIKSVDGKEVGRITSVAYSPRLNRTVALAYLKYDYLAADTAVKVLTGDQEFSAKVVVLPFMSATAPRES
ncbi:MAG TPA: glycine cleavage T C-terminal barrel domain-containing protein, partial [Pyrinomonadaceae bacterium]|nr:glycine cleavage T C-terminal barrel domain-containing protein [Pyrinomonadaceae bacterium]